MREFLIKIKDSKAIRAIKAFLSSKYYPFVTAAVTLICYYLSLDVISILYIGLTGGLIFLLLDDVTPSLSPFLCVSTLISYENSPSSIRGNSDYYLRPENLVFIILGIAVFAVSVIYRLIITCVHKKFVPNPIFYGLCALGAVFLFNGIFHVGFNLLNLMYGALMAVSLPFLYATVKDNIKVDEKTYERVCMHFLSFSILLVIELIVVYATAENLFVDGKIIRNKIIFGWGVYTGYGLFIAICLPAIVYLAGRYRYGFALTLYSAVVLTATIMCCSRQAMVAACIVYPVSLILLLIKGKNRLANMIIIGVLLCACAKLLGIYFDKVLLFFKTIFANIIVNGELNGSGRIDIWRRAIENFESAPFFGVGFNGLDIGSDTALGFRFVPKMYHNTILQMLAACGLVGFAIYTLHRIQSIVCWTRNITVERSYIALIIAVILIESLLDIHFFSITPTIVYCILLAVLDITQKKPNKENDRAKRKTAD